MVNMRFDHPLARAQLLEHGVCYTLRKRRAFTSSQYWDTPVKVSIVDTGRSGTRRFCSQGFLKESDSPVWPMLAGHLAESGFASVVEWQQAALGFSGTGTYILYRVELDALVEMLDG